MTSVDENEIICTPIEETGRGELLLELLSEEIPARMQRRAIEDLAGLLRDKLAAAEIPPSDIRGYVTPRRLVVIAEGIPQTQPDRTEERRGPRVGAPPQAIEGFLRSAGFGSINECETRDTGRGEFYFAVVKWSGRPAAEVLPELIKDAIAELPWPKSMRYPASAVQWVRPLTSILSVFDGKVLPLALDGVPVGHTTSGHRFLSPGKICVGNATEYIDRLQRAYVIVDHDRRKEIIRTDLDRRAKELGLAVKPDPALLDEVAGLAEFPVVLAGAIDADFMSLPPEVLQTAMRIHQKYFSCVDSDGGPAPNFLFVANNLAEDGGKAIIAGNERVLRARLADARFFWDQDRKIRLEDRVEALKDRVYHDKLGSVYDKVERMELIAQDIALRLDVDVARVRRGVRLAKADLSTGMVGEFPELQGIMGRYYALHGGEDKRVANAIAEHYKPLGPGDVCPNAQESIVVALADKLDTVASFFRIGERPTGSGDPYALRRAVQGIIRIILENSLRLPLTSVLCFAADPGPPFSGQRYPMELVRSLTDFIADRLWVHLRERGVRHDLIAAVFAVREDDLLRLLARVDALASFLGTDDGTNLLIAYRRATNIVSIEERHDQRRYDDDVYDSRGIQGEEKELFLALNQFGAEVQDLVKNEKFADAMAALARLRRPVDEFFNKVTVNTDDAKLRENRLRLLSRIRATMNQVADFSLIEG
jgi:glycyl-tRNA synthetase beta chain